jgi:hypothetical protein
MERRPERSDRSDRSDGSDGARSEVAVAARMNLALWLRAGRAHRGMSLDDVAKVTKIQPRILERLEAGRLDGLPAEVFVRGFVRSFARCVGLDEAEAVQRYTACGLAAGSQELASTARALIESMADLAPGSATAARATPRKMEAVEVIDLAGVAAPASVAIEPASAEPAESSPAVIEAAALPTAPAAESPASSAAPSLDLRDLGDHADHADHAERRKRRRRKGRGLAVEGPAAGDEGLPREPRALGAPLDASPVISAEGTDPRASGEPGAPTESESSSAPDASAVPGSPPPDPAGEPSAPWAPKMPQLASAPSVPWRRPAHLVPAVAAAAPVPSLVIDDADPESAERVLEERTETLAPRRSFLPPILLDREDRSARQGGLTLAVILLLIAATLTLSYLMRRPSASGDGMTGRETPASIG